MKLDVPLLSCLATVAAAQSSGSTGTVTYVGAAQASKAAEINNSFQNQMSSLDAMRLSMESAVTATGTARNAVLASIQSEAASIQSSIVGAESVAYASLAGSTTGTETITATGTGTGTSNTSTASAIASSLSSDTISSSAAGAMPTVMTGLKVVAGGAALLAVAL